MGKRPTIIDIAKQAGVSFKTVSRVLNNNPNVAEELRDRVLKAAAALDYRPNLAARSLAGPRSYTIALIMPILNVEMQSDDDWYLPAFLSDLQFAALLACQRAGYRLIVELCSSTTGTAPVTMPPGINRGLIDGIIMIPPLCDRIEMIEVLRASEIPYVLIAPGLDIGDGRSVATDEYGGAAAMTRHLLALGHRRIGFIRGPEGHRAAAARLRAYEDMLAAHDATLEPMVETGAFDFASGDRAAQVLLSRPDRPTAIFCANDDMAAGALGAATRMGIRVPEQLSIAGFDDSAVSRITSPPLTTIRQPLGAMATAAVRMLSSEDRDAPDADRHLILPYKLIERASTLPWPGA